MNIAINTPVAVDVNVDLAISRAEHYCNLLMTNPVEWVLKELENNNEEDIEKARALVGNIDDEMRMINNAVAAYKVNKDGKTLRETAVAAIRSFTFRAVRGMQ